MAVTVSIPTSRQNSLGAWKLGIADVTMDDNYPTGGETLDITDWGLVTGPPYIVLIDGAQGYHGVWDYSTVKLVVYTIGVRTGSTGTADSTAGALLEDLAGAETVIRAMDSVINTTYDLGPLKEVPSTSDLSTVKFRVLMIGE